MNDRPNSHLGRVVGASVCVFLVVLLPIFAFTGELFPNIGAPFLIAALFFLILTNTAAARNILHPSNYFLLKAGVLSFGIPAFLVSIRPDSIVSLRAPGENLLIVSLLISASFAACMIGYRSRFGHRIACSVPLITFPARRRRSQYVFSALALYAVGWIARISAWSLGLHHMNPDLGESVAIVSSVLQPLSIFAPLSFFVLLSDRVSRARNNNLSNPFSPFVLAIIGLEILAGVVDGSRTEMIMPLVHTLIVYNYSYQRLGVRALVISLVVLMVVLAPLATAYRTIYYESLAEQGASVSSAVTTLSKLSGSGTTEDIDNQIFRVSQRMSSLLEGTLVVYDKVPSQIDHAKGSTFFPSAFVNFVPRLLWSNKPIVIPGRDFAQIFWGVGIGEKYATNMGISWVGEAYYNFGWYGLGIPLLLGALLRFFVARLGVYSRRELQWMPRLYFVLFTVTNFGSFHYYPGGLVRGAMFILLYLSFLNYSFPKVMSLQSSRNLLRQKKMETSAFGLEL